MKRAFGLVVCVMACHSGGGEPRASAPLHAAAAGGFPDNPQLAYVPADTPYAFATFKPFPPDYLRKQIALSGPAVTKLLGNPAAQASRTRAIIDEIGTLDVARMEKLGFSPTARMALYGLGLYPVVRIEIADGDRVFELVQRIAKRWGETLPPPVERDGHRYWLIEVPSGLGALISVTRHEIVVAFAPRGSLEKNVAAVLGERKPASSLAASHLERIARRDGYSALGVGFIDTAAVIDGIFEVAGRDPAVVKCRAAIDEVTRGVPRLTFGYDEVTSSKLSFGAVVELAPDVLRDVKTLVTNLRGVDQLYQSRAAFGMAGGLDIAHFRAVVPKLAGVLRDISTACGSAKGAASADDLEQRFAGGLPPFLDGPVGAVFALDDMRLKPGVGFDRLDGWAAVHLRDSDLVRQMIKSQIGIDIEADGNPRPLPRLLPVAGHVAANRDTIALAVGANSSAQVQHALAASAARRILFAVLFDYHKMAELLAHLPTNTTDLESFKDFGRATMEVGVDDRGLYASGVFELK